MPESRAGASPSRDGLLLSARRVSADYFSTLGIPLLTGRPILQSDTAGAEGVVVLNKLAADAFWPGEDPIGKRLRSRSQFKTVVGVIPTFRHSRLDGELTPQMYTSYLQQPSVSRDTPPHRDPSTSVIMLRTKAGDRHAPSAVKPLLTSLEKDLIVNVATMANVRWELLAKERFRATGNRGLRGERGVSGACGHLWSRCLQRLAARAGDSAASGAWCSARRYHPRRASRGRNAGLLRPRRRSRCREPRNAPALHAFGGRSRDRPADLRGGLGPARACRAHGGPGAGAPSPGG